MPFQPALAAEIVASGEGVKGDTVVRVPGPVRMVLRDAAAVYERVRVAGERRSSERDVVTFHNMQETLGIAA